jgi:tRNA threonylcarbamoyladenosine biosynthesis protein TsaB
MKLLALDTSTEACSAALMVNNEIISHVEVQPHQQSKLLLPMLESLLSEAQLSMSSLEAIAFGCGPGSFTGLRIAASVTQGIAFSHDLPVIPVSCLQTMAQTAYQELNFKNVLSAIDAHVQAFYYGEFILNESNQCMEKIGEESLVVPEKWIAPAGKSWKHIGTGWRYFNKQAHIDYYPKASAMLPLAKKMFEQKNYVTAEEAIPTYLYELAK